jgi:MFS family permease
MSLAPYRRLLSRGDVRTLLLFGVVARVPHTAAGLVLTLHVVQTLDRGYAAAGTVAAAFTIGAALGAPWRGRAIDRRGLRRALVPSIIGELAVFGVAGFLPYAWLVAAAVVGGVMGVPIFTVMRQSLSVMVPAEQRRTAYAVDSIAVELSFMAGPALGVVVATGWSTRAGLLLVAATAGAAGLGLWVFDPPTRSEQVATLGSLPETSAAAAAAAAAVEAGDRGSTGSLLVAPGHDAVQGSRTWVSPALLAVLVASTGATLVLYGTDVGVIAQLREIGAIALTGLVFFFWGVGSITGALVYGQLRRGIHPLWLLMGLACCTVPLGLAHSVWALCALILLAGALCAPVISSTAEEVARMVPEASRGVAMGWHGSALTVGGAIGAPLAGFSIDRVGPWGGFAMVGGVGAVLAVAGLVALRWKRGSRPLAAVDQAARTTAAQTTEPVSFSPGP